MMRCGIMWCVVVCGTVLCCVVVLCSTPYNDTTSLPKLPSTSCSKLTCRRVTPKTSGFVNSEGLEFILNALKERLLSFSSAFS